MADDHNTAEREFLAASVAVWREIDRLAAQPGGYSGLDASTELRRRERAAWEAYRETLLTAGMADDPVTLCFGCRANEREPISPSDAFDFSDHTQWERFVCRKCGITDVRRVTEERK
jgi:hypothetical protein